MKAATAIAFLHLPRLAPPMALKLFVQSTRRALNLALVSLGAMIAAPASALSVTVEYTGVVSRLTYSDCQNLVNGNCNAWAQTGLAASDFVDGNNLAVGSTFAGGFTYESSAPLTAMSSDGFQAIHLNAVYDSHFKSSEVALPTALIPSSRMGSFSVVNGRDSGTRTYDTFYVSTQFSQGDWFADIGFHLMDSTGRAFDSFEVPLSLDLADFRSSVFHVAFLRRSDGDQLHLYGDLSSVAFSSVSAVPEPGTWSLLLAGLTTVAGVAARARRRAVAGRGALRPA